MFHILNYQQNSNQNHSEIPLHLIQKGCHQPNNKKYSHGYGEKELFILAYINLWKRNSYFLLLGMKIILVAMDIANEISQKN
jgi:hypothetical protein